MAEDTMRIWAKDIQYEFIVHGLSLQVCSPNFVDWISLSTTQVVNFPSVFHITTSTSMKLMSRETYESRLLFDSTKSLFSQMVLNVWCCEFCQVCHDLMNSRRALGELCFEWVPVKKAHCVSPSSEISSRLAPSLQPLRKSWPLRIWNEGHRYYLPSLGKKSVFYSKSKKYLRILK